MESICTDKLYFLTTSIVASVNDLLSDKIQFWKKKDLSLVSNIDVNIQKNLILLIKSSYPNDNIIAEESYYGLKCLDSIYSWVIDPIDGTDNFINGRKEFGISIGVMANNLFVEALLIFPALNEIYYASEKLGILKNGVHFFSQPDLNKEVVLCSKTYDNFKIAFRKKGYRVSCYKCATYSLLLVLTGKAFCYHTINTNLYDVGPMSFICSQNEIHFLDNNREQLIYTADNSIIPFFLATNKDSSGYEFYDILMA